MKNIFNDDRAFSRKLLGVKDEVRLSPFLKKILGTETREDGNEVISFRRYSLLLGIFFSIIAVLCGAAEFADSIIKSNTLLDVLFSLFIMFGAIIAFSFIIIISAVRDKEDEMYKETQRKVNETFLYVEFFIVIALAFFVSFIFNGFSITLKSWEGIYAVLFAMLALHSFIGYYYERKLGDFDREDEE